MPIEPGRQLGPYQTDAPLGAGGMGEVYKARDTRLDRTDGELVIILMIALVVFGPMLLNARKQ